MGIVVGYVCVRPSDLPSVRPWTMLPLFKDFSYQPKFGVMMHSTMEQITI